MGGQYDEPDSSVARRPSTSVRGQRLAHGHRLAQKTLHSPQGEDDSPRPNVCDPRRVLRFQLQTQGVILLFFPICAARHEPQGEGSRQACRAGRHFDPLVAAWTKTRLRSMKLNLAPTGTSGSGILALDAHWRGNSREP